VSSRERSQEGDGVTDGGQYEEAEYGLVLAFDTDEPEFTRGFEAGQLWERIERDGRVNQLIHAENAEMVMRIAEAKELAFTAEDVGDGWLQVELAPK
jgi:hypothetical protein